MSFFIPNIVRIWYNVISSLKNGLMQPPTTNREFFATDIAIVKLYQSWCGSRPCLWLWWHVCSNR